MIEARMAEALLIITVVLNQAHMSCEGEVFNCLF
jgi:hypothetical protein